METYEEAKARVRCSPGADRSLGRSVARSHSHSLSTPSPPRPPHTPPAVQEVARLKRASKHFAATIDRTEATCPVTHVRGERTLFSCYGTTDGNVLAFYCRGTRAQLDAFDIVEADLAIRPILDDISGLIRGSFSPEAAAAAAAALEEEGEAAGGEGGGDGVGGEEGEGGGVGAAAAAAGGAAAGGGGGGRGATAATKKRKKKKKKKKKRRDDRI